MIIILGHVFFVATDTSFETMAATVTITFGESSLDRLTGVALRDILSKRGITKKGKKAELVSTLRAVIIERGTSQGKRHRDEVLRILSI